MCIKFSGKALQRKFRPQGMVDIVAAFKFEKCRYRSRHSSPKSCLSCHEGTLLLSVRGPPQCPPSRRGLDKVTRGNNNKVE